MNQSYAADLGWEWHVQKPISSWWESVCLDSRLMRHFKWLAILYQFHYQMVQLKCNILTVNYLGGGCFLSGFLRAECNLGYIHFLCHIRPSSPFIYCVTTHESIGNEFGWLGGGGGFRVVQKRLSFLSDMCNFLFLIFLLYCLFISRRLAWPSMIFSILCLRFLFMHCSLDCLLVIVCMKLLKRRISMVYM